VISIWPWQSGFVWWVDPTNLSAKSAGNTITDKRLERIEKDIAALKKKIAG
jgi:hypothetical protein